MNGDPDPRPWLVLHVNLLQCTHVSVPESDYIAVQDVRTGADGLLNISRREESVAAALDTLDTQPTCSIHTQITVKQETSVHPFTEYEYKWLNSTVNDLSVRI